MFHKITLAVALLLTAFSAYPQRSRAVGSGPAEAALLPISVPGTSVSGVVTGVSGNIIALAGGLVTIDASNAKIAGDKATAVTVSSIVPGDVVFAVLSSANVAANAPLPATMIGVTRLPAVTLGGPVQAIGTNSITVLGRIINIDANTSIGGKPMPTSTLSSIAVGDVVQVQANAVNGALLASSILVFPPMPKPSTLIHGTVKSIGTDSWVITDRANKDWTIVVNAQTKIVGDPKVGDTVDVLVNTDSANQFVAVSIMKSITVQPFIIFYGIVKSTGSSSWVITDTRENKDVTVAVNAQTKISGDPHVNDGVQVTATVDAAGNYTAVSIVKLGITPPPMQTHLSGVVKSIGATSWTIGPAVGLGPDFMIQVNERTKIVGDPKVGDRVEVVAESTASGYVAISIVKV